MKTNYRSRKIVLGQTKLEEQKPDIISKIPASRFILRAHKKEEEMPNKSIPQQEEDNEDESRVNVPHSSSPKEMLEEYDCQ